MYIAHPMRQKMSRIENLVQRQDEIAKETAENLNLPKYNSYTICNLRGGIGKTSLVFNLSFLVDDLLILDTCPQGNLSFFYDNNYYTHNSVSIYDALLPYFMPGLGKCNRIAKKISATNEFFDNKNSFFIPSSEKLYIFSSQMANSMAQAKTIPLPQRTEILDNMLYSMKKEIDREKKDTNTKKILIDTSPFFSGATHLSWHASDAIIVPVRTDQQSINSLNLMLSMLSNSQSEFRSTMPSDVHSPKIQLIVLTHCGWSTRSGAKNEPNQQTKIYLEQLMDIVARNIIHFTTNNPDNHIVLLDDFLGSGRISSALSRPITLLEPGETKTINRTKVEVNISVEKIKKQLKYISVNIW
jgi:chromosome partitioning protein